MQILIIPVISALIGYITNVVAIRLLFWPRQPVNLGFFIYKACCLKDKLI